LARQSDELRNAEQREREAAALQLRQIQNLEGRAIRAEAALARKSDELHNAEMLVTEAAALQSSQIIVEVRGRVSPVELVEKCKSEAAALQAMQEIEERARRAEAALALQMDQLLEKEQSCAQLWRSLDSAQSELKKTRSHNDKLQQRFDAAQRELHQRKSEAWAYTGSDSETCSTGPGSANGSLLDIN
jgi:hypothetical protein